MKAYEVKYSEGARQDILDLADWIAAKASDEMAERYILSLVRKCESLTSAPHRGTKRNDIRPNMRVIGHKRAVSILFRVEEELALVVILGFSYRGHLFDTILERSE